MSVFMTLKGTPQCHVTVVMPCKLREDAQKYGINLSEMLRTALQNKINTI
jgi:post-segregation antitoxin (ccd killing protein)